jgi:hypothetical protein
MPYDFWNNPLVVTAFRRKYRRGTPSQTLIFYPLTLILVGMGLAYWIPEFRKDWPRISFLLLMIIQSFISGLAASVATSASMKTEVAKQTLDFQRITSLSPRQILLGKLLGESAMAYFLIIAVLPLAFACWAFHGFAPELLVLAVVNLVAHTTLSGSAGLVQPLEVRDNKSSEGVVWIGALPLCFPGLFVLGWALFDRYDWDRVAWLCFFPVVQLTLAFVAFHIMERRLENPLLPAVAKPVSYLLLLLADVAALVLVQLIPGSFSQRCTALLAAHLIIGTSLASSVTPVYETSKSWVWRFRGRVSRMRDSLLGDRAENGMVLVIYVLVGLAFVLVETGVAWLEGNHEEILDEANLVLRVAGVSALLLLAYGTIYQFFLFRGGRKGKAAFSALCFAILVFPMMAGGILDALNGPPRRFDQQHDPLAEFVLSFSPIAHFTQWLSKNGKPFSIQWLLALYGFLLVFCWLSLRQSLYRLEREVDRKLAGMGVRRERSGVSAASTPASGVA